MFAFQVLIALSLQSPELRAQVQPPPAALLAQAEASGAMVTDIQWLALPQVDYPSDALNRTEGGKAILACIVSTEGRARLCEIAEELPAGFGFGEAALDAAPTYRFAPRTLNSQPIEAISRFTISFVASDSPTPPANDGAVAATPLQQRAFGSIDRLGFDAGRCFATLDPASKQDWEQRQAAHLALAPEARPVFDEVLYAALERGKGQESPSVSACEALIANAERGVADAADAIRQIEMTFPPAVRRP